MTKKQLLFIASFAFMLGCNQNGVVGLESGKTLHSLSADNNAIIDPDSIIGGSSDDDANEETISGICAGNAIFESAVLESQQDQQFIGISNTTHFDEPFRVVSVLGVSGSVIFDSVNELSSARSISGNLVANVKSAGVVSGISGSVCLKAETIQKIESISGPSKIIANSIEEMKSLSGEIHIHKAKIKTLLSNSGQICLHDGATIDEVIVNSGSIQNCN